MIPEVERLRQLTPLDKLSRRSLAYLRDNFEIQTRERGELLFAIGDTRSLCFYLLEGAVSMRDAKDDRVMIESGSERGNFPLGNLLPRLFEARVASAKATILCIDKEMLDKEIAWGQLARMDGKGRGTDNNDWKISLLHTPIFARLPMRSVQCLFDEMEEVRACAGQTIVEEGGPGDYYYMIRAGRCKVVRRSGVRQVTLCILEAPAGFGDEALVSNEPRNASVVMASDGLLMRLAKERFRQLMQDPLTRRVDLNAVRQSIRRRKAILIDVRMEEEYAHKHLPHAINIPLFLLYLKLRTLNKDVKYILYCDTGARSESAAFILTRYGFDSRVLSDAANQLAGIPDPALSDHPRSPSGRDGYFAGR